MLNLRIAAAQYVLGQLQSSALPAIATDALVRNLDSPAARVLAGLVGADMAEAGPAFERMLDELYVTQPTHGEAIRVLLKHYIQRVGRREIGPREGLRQLIELYNLADSHGQIEKYVGDDFGIEHLVGAYWAYEDLEERPTEVSFQGLYGAEAIRAFDEDVVRLSNEWLAKHGA